jgi:hypothetical protein
MTYRVAIGCTTRHDYSSLLIFAALLWRERIGYEPILFLIGDEDEAANLSWGAPTSGLVYNALFKFGFQYELIDGVKGIEGATLSQCVRHHAAAMDFPEEDILIPSDADLFPLRKEFYYQHQKDITLYYYNGYPGEEESHWPTCHQSASVKVWREMMGLDPAKSVRENLLRSLEESNIRDLAKARAADPQDWAAEWFFDEHFSSRKIKESRFYPNGIHRIAREGHPPKDRLDRAHRPSWKNANVNNYVDAHTVRPAWDDENWSMLRPLIEQTMPQHLAWADAFRLEFKKEMRL